jgi:hypothetical protein
MFFMEKTGWNNGFIEACRWIAGLTTPDLEHPMHLRVQSYIVCTTIEKKAGKSGSFTGEWGKYGRQRSAVS